ATRESEDRRSPRLGGASHWRGLCSLLHRNSTRRTGTMVKHIAAACALTATSILTFACEDSVQDEMRDLREAREGTQAEVDELRQELQTSKERVKQLEKDLAMAERGVTGDVLKERQELGE